MSRLRLALPLVAGLGLALLPPPDGLSPHAWHYFAVFVAVILFFFLFAATLWSLRLTQITKGAYES